MNKLKKSGRWFQKLLLAIAFYQVAHAYVPIKQFNLKRQTRFNLCLYAKGSSFDKQRQGILPLPPGMQIQDSLLPPNKSTNIELTLRNQLEEFDPFHLEEFTGVRSKAASYQEVISTVAEDVKPSSNNLDMETENDGSKLGVWASRALLLFVAMLWGTNFASVKYLETICLDPPCVHLPSEAALARFGVAAAVSIPLLRQQPWPVIAGGLECGLWITIGYITQAMALPLIASGKCAFICSLTVVLVPIMSAMFFGKEIKPIHFVSAAIALAGVSVLEGIFPVDQLLRLSTDSATATSAIETSISLSTSISAESGSDFFDNMANTLGVGTGDILALGQPLGFGFAFMRIEHYVDKFKHVPNRIMTISAAQCVAVGVLSLFWVLFDFHGQVPDFRYMLEPHYLIPILWTGVVTTVVAIYLEGVALEKCSASEAALTFSSEPVWASMFGAWLLRERLDASSYIGGSVILTACVLGALADIDVSAHKKEPSLDSLDTFDKDTFG